jgi:hypothetical protein
MVLGAGGTGEYDIHDIPGFTLYLHMKDWQQVE